MRANDEIVRLGDVREELHDFFGSDGEVLADRLADIVTQEFKDSVGDLDIEDKLQELIDKVDTLQESVDKLLDTMASVFVLAD